MQVNGRLMPLPKSKLKNLPKGAWDSAHRHSAEGDGKLLSLSVSLHNDYNILGYAGNEKGPAWLHRVE